MPWRATPKSTEPAATWPGTSQAALEGRAVIEQAKDMVSANLGIPADQALQLLRRTSQDTNQKMRDLAAQLIAGDIDPRRLHRH